MPWLLIPIILFFLSLAIITIILFRKKGVVSILNAASLPGEKVNHMKNLLLQKRLERVLKDRFNLLWRLSLAGWNGIGRLGRRLVQKVYALEQHYRKMQKGTTAEVLSAEAVRKVMDEADDLIKKEEYFQAEKKYIEIISQHPKDVKAYEALGNLYLLDRKYDQARETFGFALKLKSDDASIYAAIGELETKEGNNNAALTEFSKAVEIRPNNPRYLDFMIESAISAGNAAEAQRGLNKLKEVNPENQKLTDFEQRINIMGK